MKAQCKHYYQLSVFSECFTICFAHIHANPYTNLEPNHKMASSVRGFTAPGVITHFCLRTPEEVSLTNDGREFTQLALFSPLLSLSVLVLSCMAGEPQKEDHGDDILETDDEERPDEITPLAPKRSPGRGRASDRRRRSTDEAERPNKNKTIEGPHKKRSMMEAGRSGSI